MPAYNLATVALAVGSEPKWLDNLLSHHDVPGASGGTRGLSRRISPEAVLVISIAKTISAALGAPLARALLMAQQAVENPSDPIPVAPGFSLSIDVTGVRNALDARIAEALEVATPIRRGRPPGSRAGRRSASPPNSHRRPQPDSYASPDDIDSL